MKKTIILALMATCLVLACKKNKDQDCTLITANIVGTYKVKSISYKASPSAPEQEYFSELYPDACDRDNLYIYKANGVFEYQDAGEQCLVSGATTSTWSLSGSKLIIGGQEVSVQSFDCKEMVIMNKDIEVAGDEAKFTFTRQ